MPTIPTLNFKFATHNGKSSLSYFQIYSKKTSRSLITIHTQMQNTTSQLNWATCHSHTQKQSWFLSIPNTWLKTSCFCRCMSFKLIVSWMECLKFILLKNLFSISQITRNPKTYASDLKIMILAVQYHYPPSKQALICSLDFEIKLINLSSSFKSLSEKKITPSQFHSQIVHTYLLTELRTTLDMDSCFLSLELERKIMTS